MKTVVVKMLSAAGSRGRGAAFGWVGCDARDGEAAEETVGDRGEPGGVAWLGSGKVGSWIELTEGGEEIVDEGFVEG